MGHQVSIITVGMNHLKFLKDFFDSVFEQDATTLDFEVIYVDNCSKDGSVEYIKGNYPKVRIIENEKPLGFGANNNKAAKFADGKYLAILNPDIILKAGALDKLYNYSESHTGWGVLAPKLLNADGTLQYSVRSFMTFRTMLSRLVTWGKDHTNNSEVNEYLCKESDDSVVRSVDWAIGAALFIAADFFKEMNGFDEDYYLYLEDEDFCLRTWSENKEVIYIPDAEMKHMHLRSSTKFSRMTLIHFWSMLTYFRKHGLSVSREKIVGKIDKPVARLFSEA